ncbi:rRNA-processing protein [Colletotrichum tofieldiae]|uniref:rRNA-processing protein n=1 Tax=Colletotrichum tofieldiae TaxID=708197 RepID=A0A166QHA6_9PEZI|nr:rRNA-processing protein [Colletotrichum tofieldiae]GKT53298.1 rRNA-processing protein [Colletotrichum tofieldiae]GKT80861.1 rRNA-processing protein [Colletotrichum tofieldiae]GKT88281.1 rRNA-processing protein [Colletotrichum tofieldiae]
MSAPSPNGAPARRVDWAALKSYVAEKERFEAEHGHPAPLSETELSAIAVLLRPAPRLEPEVGSNNWLGLLNHFQQVRSQKVTFSDVSREYPRLGKAPDLRWACTATFASTGDVFPQPGYGMEITNNPVIPDFQRKQDAKQYAAKAACEWLIDNGQMLPSGDLPKYPKPFAPAASAAIAFASPSVSVLPSKRPPPSSLPAETSGFSSAAARKKKDTLPARASSSLPPHLSNNSAAETSAHKVTNKPSPPAPASNPLSSPATTSTESTPSANAGALVAQSPSIAPRPQEPSATQRVRELCARLKYPVPHYKLTEDTTVAGGDFWNGHADFSNDLRVPDGLGTVHKVLTRKAAKDRMSEDILAWLLREQERRDRRAKTLLEDTGE